MELFALTLDGMKAWCERKKLRYMVNEQLGQLAIPRPVDPPQAIRVIPRPERGMMTFAVPLPFAVPKDRHVAMDQALALVNSASYMGAWVLNHQRDEAYFRVTVPTRGVGYEDGAVEYLLQIVIGSVDRITPGLRAVALEGAPPERILASDDPNRSLDS